MRVDRPRAALNAQLFRANEGYRSAGISRYIYHLLRELPAVAPEFDLDVYSTEPEASILLSGVTVRKTRVSAHKPLARILWEQTLFALELFRHKYDLLHSLAYVSPFLNRTPAIVTVYDLSFYLYPELFPPLQRLYLQIGARASVRRARRIVTISENTKQDTVRLLKVSPKKIDVALPGVDPQFFADADENILAAFRREKNLTRPFALFIGTLEPRKNIPTLLGAFARAKRQFKLPHALVIAGGRGWIGQEIPRAVEEYGLTNDILFPGFVPASELPLWYRAADVFVYPSQYEGFGMPALEALACGTPVITSNVSSLPEAVGDAAILVDPHSIEETAEALGRVLTAPGLAQEMRVRGVEHALKFSWRRTAQETAQSYRLALGLTVPVPQLALASP